MKKTIPLALILVLHISCNSTRPMDSLSPRDTLRTTPTAWQKLTQANKVKIQNSTVIIAQDSKVESSTAGEIKGSTQSSNEQNASGGSTIGAASFQGADISKTKGSAVTEAQTTNTGGQGSKVEGSAEVKSTNQQASVWKWLLLAFAGGIVFRQFLPKIWGGVKRVFLPMGA
ncbi:hypothetical protein [Rufibacter latericius]|nr:hypothetical protein [Rufibacter latericius]